MTLDPSGLPTLWRIKLRSSMPGVESAERQVAYCRDHHLIGCGWGLGDLGPDSSLHTVLEKIASRKDSGWGARAAGMIRRFAEADVDEFVWTRDTHGRYLLCRIKGP